MRTQPVRLFTTKQMMLQRQRVEKMVKRNNEVFNQIPTTSFEKLYNYFKTIISSLQPVCRN